MLHACCVQVGKLLQGVSAQSSQHQEMLLRMAAAGLEALAQLPPASRLGSEEEFSARFEASLHLSRVVNGPD